MGSKAVPYLISHDGRTFRFPDPELKANDVFKLDLETGEIKEHIKCATGSLCMITGACALASVCLSGGL